jgi:biofilm PGA synthesis N-glycosyltransferase PgaC
MTNAEQEGSTTNSVISAEVEPGIRYAVISAVRNEELYIARTAEALVAQTLRPVEWIIVDDGSTDGTRDILRGYAKQQDRLRIIELGELGGSNRCSRVMRAFFAGYREIGEGVDYIIKIDGDVTFEPDHIERLLAHFDEDRALGIASGTYMEPAGSSWRVFTLPEGYAVGALRAYRAECLRSIMEAVEPLTQQAETSPDNTEEGRRRVPTLSWDSIDHLYAGAAGWRTRCFHELMIVHHRTEGAREHVLAGLFEQGVVSYVMGYHPLYAVARGLRKTVEYPYVVGGIALTAGYLTSAMRRDVERADERTRHLVRESHMRRIRNALRRRLHDGRPGVE